MNSAKLIEEWDALGERRPTLREVLSPYRQILEAWGRWREDDVRPLRWSAAECGERWGRGVPLLSEARPAVPRDEMEDLLASVLEGLATATGDEAALHRLTEAWDRLQIGPSDFFPQRGRMGSAALAESSGLAEKFIAFLAYGSLRPALESYFVGCRAHLGGAWDLGVCPFCGGPPGFADVVEDVRRRLRCHLCGGDWVFSRMQCPFCANQTAKDLVRLDPGETEEGYFIAACKQCRGYIKELDRRIRWNGGSPLVEDWGSPHFDLAAYREGYWRPDPPLIQLAAGV